MTTATASRPAHVEGKWIPIVEATSDPSVFLVHSQSEPNKKYTVADPDTESPACECPDYMYRNNRNCKHIRSVSQQLKEAQMSDQEWSSTETIEYTDPNIALYAALAKAQSEAGNAVKRASGQVGRSEYKYADLRAVDAAISEALTNNGLAIIQFPGLYKDGCQHLKNVIVHKDGGSIEHEMSIPCKNDAQGAGSGLTYARRYALVGIMRVITEDDDGRGAMHNNDSRGYTDQRETPAPRPAQSATREFTNVPPVSQGQLGGTPNLAQMMALCRNTGFPSTGMLGAFLAASEVFCPPTEELVDAWFDRNPGAIGDQLLTEAGAWYESQGWANAPLKAKARKWREEQRVAA